MRTAGRPSLATAAALALAVAGAGAGTGCAASSAELKAARSSAYQGSYDEVWQRTVEAVGEEYPYALLLDKPSGQIVTCWRAMKMSSGGAVGSTDSGRRYFFRVSVQVSKEAPYRITVVGRAALFRQPQFVPLEYDDPEDPGWVQGRTERITVQIYERLKALAVAATTEPPPLHDQMTPETFSDTCVIRPESAGFNNYRMKLGHLIGKP